ncbi:MAG: glycosyltransferase [Kiritimatiellae bacterium]|nr:glycosyltransferase [Kiritimatiellia bacterium]
MNQASDQFDHRGKRIGIFVIAYNAESHIAETLDRIPADVWQAVTVVYVIDDCSTDETVEKALGYARRKDKLVVIRNRVNRRYGGNQKLGYQYALDQSLDAVVMLHADGQYAPEHLPRMLEPIVNGEADVVIGSRMMEKGGALRGGMPKYKYVGNIVLTKIQNALTGMGLAEFHSGYRAYSTSLLRRVLFWENSDEWHFDTQILLQAHQSGARIREIPIPTFYGDEICRVNGIAYGTNCIFTSLGYWLFKHGVYYSRKYDINARGLKYFSKFGDPFSSHSLLWKRLQAEGLEGKRVLELGVGDASVTKRMHEHGAIVDGIEVDPMYAELAKPYCRRVFNGDLNRIEALGLAGQYDIVLAADVLEHVIDPEVVLSKLKAYAKKEGLLIVSLPNVANIYVRGNLFLGRFPYYTKGILDATHLHFYTLASARKTLVKTGWVIEDAEVTAIPFALVFPFLGRMPMRLLLNVFYGLTRVFKGLLAYQGMFYCRNPNLQRLL